MKSFPGAGFKVSRSSLHYSSAHNHPNVVTLLSSNDCTDINMKDDEGCTPLIKAAQRDNLECISILLRLGADPHIMDASGYTALHHAICRGNIPVVSKLLEYNVDINAKTEYGLTPCALALFANQYEMASFLIEYSEGAPSELTPNRLSENPHVTTEDTATTAIEEDIDNSSSRYTVETKKGGFLPPPNMHDIVPQPPARADVTSTFHVSERGDNLQSSEGTTVNTTSVDHTPSSVAAVGGFDDAVGMEPNLEILHS